MPSNEIWFVTDRDNEFQRLASMDLSSKKITYYTSNIPWNVLAYELSDDKTKLAFVTNEGGLNKLYLMDTSTKKINEVKNIPIGLISGITFTKNGNSLFFTQSTADSSSDVYQLDLSSNKIVSWTESELGEMQKEDMSKPKFIIFIIFFVIIQLLQNFQSIPLMI